MVCTPKPTSPGAPGLQGRGMSKPRWGCISLSRQSIPLGSGWSRRQRQRGKESERAGASRASQKANATCFPILFEIKMDITKTPNCNLLPFICRTYYEQNRAFDSEFLKSFQRCSWQRAHQRYISADSSSVRSPLMSWKSSASVSQLKQSLETGRGIGVLFRCADFIFYTHLLPQLLTL